ncbi:hypothetical protein OF377_00390 [Ureaplasma sp. ES3154-GEN]|uniref:hypothetical protein n=1 Tax=Ureaplasma sp. ES3154-GEN TaxID=2984844 RepID=UPI0021E96DC3|nr:hypothetical protein [Ureaplasma sp. ES3154-GEN]MCV3743346.1 hypothetical protein [Ureaplasma sp. ES3154-GEN]
MNQFATHNKRSNFASSFKINATNKSPNLIKFLVTLFVVVFPMIILFLLFGEPNLLGQNNIVGENGRWYGLGILNETNYPSKLGFYKWLDINNQIANATGSHKDALIKFQQYFLEENKYDYGTGVLSGYEIWVGMTVNLLFALVLGIILVFSIKKVRWDILVPIVASWFGFFIMIITGFIPSYFWGYLIRFVIVLVSFILPIVIMVRITNAMIARSKNVVEYTTDIFNEYQDAEAYYQAGGQKILELKKQNKVQPNDKFKIEKDEKDKK